MRRPRRNHSPRFNARVALDALRGEKTGGATGGADPAADREKIQELHAKIGELSVENDFLERVLGRFPGPSGRK